MPRKNKGGPTRSRGTRRKVRRSRVRTIHLSELAAGVKLIDSMFGLDNLARFDFKGAMSQASQVVQTGDVGAVAIDTAVVYAATEAPGRLISIATGKRPGITVGKWRFSV